MCKSVLLRRAVVYSSLTSVSTRAIATLLFGAQALMAPVWAQTTQPQTTQPPAPARSASAAARAASAPQRAASAPARAASSPAADAVQQVQINGSRESDTEQRRRSTASKIVIGREEIDKFGDATVGEVLRRLPGITTPGAPGRGGPPRMRGLGNGYTQLLIDGQRIPPGFSLESLTPEQIERIEILRAPTAETGAQAIAGTINIITREGFRRRLNDLRLGFGYENGKASPGVFWTHNDSAGPLTYNISGSAFESQRKSSNTTHTTVNAINPDGSTGTLLEDRTGHSTTTEHRPGLNLTGRLQWRLNEANDSLSLMPMVFHSQGKSHTDSRLDQALSRPPTVPFAPTLYDYGNSDGDSSFTNARLGTQWRQRVGPARLEMNATGGSWQSRSDTYRYDFLNAATGVQRYQGDHSRTREKQLLLSLKGSGLAGGDEHGGEHTLVAGVEADGTRRTENRTIDGAQDLQVDFGDNLKASAIRLAAYAQDEWNITPSWGAHAGLRWEGITTRGDSPDSIGDTRPTNRSSVWTPLLHAVWKPDPKSRDQVRFSLTRAYRAPPLGSLIAKPTINRNYPLGTANPKAYPDGGGNPTLKPELSTGIDIAVERYLEAGGVLSANVFHRQISNLMRAETRLETVSYSTLQRYVRRQQNIGDASTSGIELDAKFRLDQLIPGATPVELRTNAAVFRSSVKAIPGPDNRLDQQAKATANIGADYRLRGMPLTIGGNGNWVPGYATQADVDQRVTVSTKLVWDAFALWTFSPTVGLRVLGSNLAARDYTNTTVTDALTTPTANERTAIASTGPSFINWQLRLELKL